MSMSAASSASYEANAWGIRHSAAYARARAASRLATAATMLRAESRIAGMSSRLMRAVPSRPQRSAVTGGAARRETDALDPVAAEARGEDRFEVRLRAGAG